jgi:hypothetical protein
MAVFALGVVAAATALANEPSGILYLPGEAGPVVIEGGAVAKSVLTVGTDKVVCEDLVFEGELGNGEGSHSTLGFLEVEYTGCEEPVKKAKCRSENAKGEKDSAGTILLRPAGTDLHTVSLEGAKGELAPGLLVGLLEVEKLDLTINCGLVKVLVLGAQFLEVKGATEDEHVLVVEVVPTTLACDKNDKLCKEELAKWGAVVGGKLCALAGRLAETEFCARFEAEPVLARFTKEVLLDF